MRKLIKAIIFVTFTLTMFSGCTQDTAQVETSEDIEGTLSSEEEKLLFGEWRIKELIGFTGVNDNESEIQNYPYGPNVINSSIFISNENIKYTIEIDTKNPIPDLYVSESIDEYEISNIYVFGNSAITPDEFLQSQGTSGAFQMDEKYMPKDNVKEIYVTKKGNDYPTALVQIIDDNRVIWHMYGAYFELEKIK